MKRLFTRLIRWLKRQDASPIPQDEYLSWADARLDDMAEQARLGRQMAERGYWYVQRDDITEEDMAAFRAAYERWQRDGADRKVTLK